MIKNAWRRRAFRRNSSMSETKHANKYFGEVPVGKLMLKFGIPCIISMVIAAFYNMVDQIFVGHGVGYLGNGAANVVYPLTVIVLAIALMIGNGCASCFSIAQGKKDDEKAHRAVGNAIVMVFAVSIMLVLVYAVFRDQILHLFGATENNFPYAKAYFTFIIIGVPFYMMDNALNAMIRADGSPKYAMAATCTGCLLNIVLDPIFIFLVYKDDPVKAMGGAAIATIIGQIVSCLIAICYLFKTKSFRLKKQSFRFKPNICGQILSLGFSSLITQCTMVCVMAVINNTLVKYGALSKFGEDIPLTVLGVVLKVNSIFISITTGLAVGLQPIIGYNYGAKNMNRIKEIIHKLVITEFCIGTVAVLFFQLFPLQIVSIFGSGNALYEEFAVNTMRIYLSCFMLAAVQKSCGLFMQSLGKPTMAVSMCLLREAIHIPAVLLLPMAFGLLGLLWAAPISDVISFTLTIIITFKMLRRIEKEANQSERTQEVRHG